MYQNKHKQATGLVKILLFSLGIMLSGHSFGSNHSPGWQELPHMLQPQSQLLTAYAIGDRGPAGGIVFIVLGSGEHGWEAAPVDQSNAAPWGCAGTDISGADGQSPGTGAQNTADILDGCTEAGIAAKLANDYVLNGYTDWFLPSTYMLEQMWEYLGHLGGGRYWSSSERLPGHAWSQSFTDGDPRISPKQLTSKVRAIRFF